MRAPVIGVVLAAGLACGTTDSPGFTSSGGPGVTSVSTGGPASSSTGGGAGSSTGPQPDGSTSLDMSGQSSADEGPGLDMDMPDFGEVGPKGCQGKIDFLFVISPDWGMEYFQQRLVESFPGFIGSIESHFPNFDVHIMSADGDGYWGMSECSYCEDECYTDGSPPLCGAKLDECDLTYGAGVTFPSGQGASNRRCNFAGGKRYITSAESDIAAAFACTAQVGIDGTVGVAQGMVEAIKPGMNAKGSCNEGFLRDDALLVVVLIQGVIDTFSLGTPQEWIAALRDAKHGDDDAFAVLVLATDADLGYGGQCSPDDTQPENPLRTLVNGVEHGFIDSICKDDYEPFFDAAVGEVITLCDNLVPK